MIYNCSNCGALFDIEEIKRATEKDDGLLKCNYCGCANHIAKPPNEMVTGFIELSKANFSEASWLFSVVIRKLVSVPSEVYLGQALAHYSIQAIFTGVKDNKLPRLIFYDKLSIRFSATEDFRKALEQARDEKEITILYQYAYYIDKVYETYLSLEKSMANDYFTFIAYEDAPNDDNISENGKDIAADLFNDFHTNIKRHYESRYGLGKYSVYMPEYKGVGAAMGKPEDDGRVLFGIMHSKTMVVVVDDEPDARLQSIYNRFFINSNYSDENIAFYCITDNTRVPLPGSRRAKNIFRIETRKDLEKYIASRVGVIISGKGADTIPGFGPVPGPVSGLRLGSGGDLKVENGIVYFGEYPQRRLSDSDEDAAIKAEFEKLELPDSDDDKGWILRYKSSNGRNCGWIRDEVIDGKKYRAVYYKTLRPKYSAHYSNVFIQRKNNFNQTEVLRIFEFMPIEWNIIRKEDNYSVLAARAALDSIEFNQTNGDDFFWETSTLRTWLEETFINDAFTEEQQEMLGSVTASDGLSDKVLLLRRDYDKEYLFENVRLELNDYFKCLGGEKTEGGVQFWTLKDGEYAETVFSDSRKASSEESADCTAVAVLPKILVNLNNGK